MELRSEVKYFSVIKENVLKLKFTHSFSKIPSLVESSYFQAEFCNLSIKVTNKKYQEEGGVGEVEFEQYFNQIFYFNILIFGFNSWQFFWSKLILQFHLT